MTETVRLISKYYYAKIYNIPVNLSDGSAVSFYLSVMGEYSMGDALKSFLQKSRLKSTIQSLQITDVWEQIMGKTIAKYTDKIQIINRTLFITTSVAPLKNELLYQKEKIIQRVNEAMGEALINEVVIQ